MACRRGDIPTPAHLILTLRGRAWLLDPTAWDLEEACLHDLDILKVRHVPVGHRFHLNRVIRASDLHIPGLLDRLVLPTPAILLSDLPRDVGFHRPE